MTEPAPKYVKAPFEIRYGGGLLVPGDPVPAALVADVPEDALTDEAPPVPEEPSDEAPGGTTGGTGATGGTGDAPNEPFELEGE